MPVLRRHPDTTERVSTHGDSWEAPYSAVQVMSPTIYRQRTDAKARAAGSCPTRNPFGNIPRLGHVSGDWHMSVCDSSSCYVTSGSKSRSLFRTWLWSA